MGLPLRPKEISGPRVSESARFGSRLPSVDVVALLTTGEGLSRWLGTPTHFAAQRGRRLSFTDGDVAFTGSYSLIDVPSRVVIVTDLHGEIDIRTELRRTPGEVAVTITAVATDDADAARLRGLADDTLARLRGACGDVD